MKEIDRMRNRLVELHRRTGDLRYLRAAEVLAGPRITTGRNRSDDQPHLLRMAWLIHHGYAPSVWAAAGSTARDVEGHSFDATRKRLNRKYLKQRSYYTYLGPFICQHIEGFQEGVTNAVPAAFLKTRSRKEK